MKKLLVIGLVLAVSLLIVGSALAAEDKDSQTSEISLTVPDVCKLDIASGTVEKTLLIDSDAETAFEAGYVDLSADSPVLTVDANSQWTLSAAVTTAFAEVTHGTTVVTSYIKSVDDLQLQVTTDKGAEGTQDNFSTFEAITAVGKDICHTTATVSDSGGSSNDIWNCQYRILLDWNNDLPGTYTATVTYTLVTVAQ